jgi:gliding motility-associated-like protein
MIKGRFNHFAEKGGMWNLLKINQEKRKSIKILVVAFTLVAVINCKAQLPNPLELNTAANGVNAKIAIGRLDTNWTVADGNESGPTSPFLPSLVVGNCAPVYWYSSSFPNADWIIKDVGFGRCYPYEYQKVEHYFRRKIFLPATNNCGQPISASYCLTMDFYADNSVAEIKVNDTSNYLDTLNADPYFAYGFRDTTTVNLCKGWKPGENSIVVHIKSGAGPAAFLAQANLKMKGTSDSQIIPFSIKKTVCQGETYLGYSNSGTYIDTLLNLKGCDSIRTLTLEVTSKTSIKEDVKICQGETYEGYSKTGVYTDEFTSSTGCDITRTLTLTVLPNPTSSQSVSLCQGEVYQGYNKSGIYLDTLTSAKGCDSVRTINLEVNTAYKSFSVINICEGLGYKFNGVDISTEGRYAANLKSIFGCDSIVEIELKITRGNFLGNDKLFCNLDEYTLISPFPNTRWFDNEVSKTKRVNKSGTYWASIVDDNGCEIKDSVNIRLGVKSFTPNTFTPNDDGINDCFKPFFAAESEITSYRFSVFDRWGNHVYTTTNMVDCWDGMNRGKECAQGTYVYFWEIITRDCGSALKKGELILTK